MKSNLMKWSIKFLKKPILMAMGSQIFRNGRQLQLIREIFYKKKNFKGHLNSLIRYCYFSYNLKQDGSGSISANEIKIILGGGKKFGNDKIWDEIIKEVDVNGDGEISYEEFKLMM